MKGILKRVGTAALGMVLLLCLAACGGKSGERTERCTISISCAAILDNRELLTAGKETLLPEDGWLLKETQTTFAPGESVFDVLLRTVREHKIHMEYSDTPIYDSAYIEGIGNLYEFDCGSGSGWMYRVNGWFPNYGCSRYELRNGDVIELIYTCDLGADVGGEGVMGR